MGGEVRGRWVGPRLQACLELVCTRWGACWLEARGLQGKEASGKDEKLGSDHCHNRGDRR